MDTDKHEKFKNVKLKRASGLAMVMDTPKGHTSAEFGKVLHGLITFQDEASSLQKVSQREPLSRQAPSSSSH